MRRGDRITVWENPVTRQCAEGTAVLIRKSTLRPRDGGEHWVVRFEGGADCDPDVTRLVFETDIQRRTT